MENVFCGRCRYFFSEHLDMCKHPDNLKLHVNWRNDYKTSIKHPRVLNKNNNCKWFKSVGILEVYEEGINNVYDNDRQ